MPKIPGVNHLDAIRALEKAGFRIVRQGKHVVMSDGVRILTIPRHNPVNAFTMGGIARDAGLTVEQFKKLFESDAIQPALAATGFGVPFIDNLMRDTVVARPLNRNEWILKSNRSSVEQSRLTVHDCFS